MRLLLNMLVTFVQFLLLRVFACTARTVVALATLILAPVAVAQTDLRVDGTNGSPVTANPPPDGSDWGTPAYLYLADAIKFAEDNPGSYRIWVRAGTYYPDEGNGLTNNSRVLTFKMLNNVKILGGFDTTETNYQDRNPLVNVTILSGDLQQNDNPTTPSTLNDNSYHVVTGELVLATAVIDGFTIKAGNAQKVGSVTVPVPACSGMNCPTTGTGCDFGLTNGEVGGGMFLYGVPTFQDCGLCEPLVMRCTFEGNRAKAGGGVFYSASQLSNPIFGDCVFAGNLATGDDTPGVPSGGGAVRVGTDSAQLGHPTFVNCLFVNNSAETAGGGIFVGGAAGADVYNCTFVDNNTPETDGGAAIEHGADCVVPLEGAADLKSCIVSGEDAPQILGAVHADRCWVTDVDEICPKTGHVNFVDDPVFVNASIGNYRLQSTSPCIDEGINGHVEGVQDPGDIDQDGVTTEAMPDLGGLLRIISPRNAAGCRVDSGAFEFQPTIVCAGDADFDCDVDVDDLIMVILNWGPCEESPCDGDVSTTGSPCGTGVVDVDDLIAVITSWTTACTGCTSSGQGAGADPGSYADCQNLCDGKTGQAWIDCMQSCFWYLCHVKEMTEFCDP